MLLEVVDCAPVSAPLDHHGGESEGVVGAVGCGSFERELLGSVSSHPDHVSVGRRAQAGSGSVGVAGVVAFAEYNNVYLLEADWNDKFIENLISFPNAKHDDMVDTAVMGMSHAMLAKR